MTTASDLMRSCLIMRDAATVADLLERIEQWPVCAVVDSKDRLIGILTEHDLAKLIYESGQFDDETTIAGRLPAFLGMSVAQLRAVPITEIMTAEPDTVGPQTGFDELMQLIFRNRRVVLPVVSGGRLLGVVHRMDAIKKVLG
ncbi:MAG TPA: CBS domain-containing protein [Symbiobacteriaceae bacterium]|nr:CBS domain-containing protein [Symbiobacteriaceae bacterium]